MLIIYIFRIQCTCMMWKGKTVCERTERANRTIRFLSNQGTLREPNVKPTELNKKTNHEVIKRPIVCTLKNFRKYVLCEKHKKYKHTFTIYHICILQNKKWLHYCSTITKPLIYYTSQYTHKHVHQFSNIRPLFLMLD